MDKFKEFYYINRKNIIIVFAFLLVLGGIYIYMNINGKKQINDSNNDSVLIEKNTDSDKIIIEEEYYVDIKGQIKKPGVYLIQKDKRIIDVIKMAGGLTKNADTVSINLSKKISDEMVIIIHSKSEIKNFSRTQEIKNKISGACNNATIIKNDACIDGNFVLNSNNKISINTATLEELIAIPNIGEAKAKAIISYRDENGKFERIEDIVNVSGFGESIFEKIKEYITI